MVWFLQPFWVGSGNLAGTWAAPWPWGSGLLPLLGHSFLYSRNWQFLLTAHVGVADLLQLSVLEIFCYRCDGKGCFTGSKAPWQCPFVLGPLRAKFDFSPFSSLRKAAWNFSVGKRETISQRTESLFPSTINKVHHDGGGYKKPLTQGWGMGRNYHCYPSQRIVDHFLQQECWLLRLPLLLYFFSTMELLVVKRKEKYFVGLAESMSRNHKNWLLFEEVYVTMSRKFRWLFFSTFILKNSGEKFFSNIYQIGSWHF